MGVPPSVRPMRAKLDYDHGSITYQLFSSAAAGVGILCWFFGDFLGEEKMDLDKSVVFAFDGVPAHLQLYIWPFPPHMYTAYASPLDIVEKDLSCLKATPKADILSTKI